MKVILKKWVNNINVPSWYIEDSAVDLSIEKQQELLNNNLYIMLFQKTQPDSTTDIICFVDNKRFTQR